ncbi:unnamed protein product [Sympodiomycopsis kandeliae]
MILLYTDTVACAIDQVKGDLSRPFPKVLCLSHHSFFPITTLGSNLETVATATCIDHHSTDTKPFAQWLIRTILLAIKSLEPVPGTGTGGPSTQGGASVSLFVAWDQSTDRSML